MSSRGEVEASDSWFSVPHRQPQGDLYTKLTKLDELKKGILRDAEFEAQRRKILEGQ